MKSEKKGDGKDREFLKFPCEFPIKVMGRANSDLKMKSLKIILKHCPDYCDTPKERLSQDKNYLSLTYTIKAHSREQLDAIYIELTRCNEVLMTL